MKKKLIGFLIMTLIVSTNVALLSTISVQAETTDSSTTTEDKIKVSLDNIREIMVENSLDMKKYYNTLQISKEQYEQAKENYKDTSKPDKSDYGDDTASYTTAKAAYDKLEETYENAKTAYKKAKDTYDQNVEKAVYTAEQDYLNYLSTLANKELQEDTVKAKDRDVKIDGLKYDYGFMSQNDYISSTQNTTDANVKLASLTNDEALQKDKLCNELGVRKSEVIIEVDVTEDFKKITEINYDDDLQTMLENNYEIKNAKDSLDDLEDSDDSSTDDSDYAENISDYNTNNAKIDLKLSKQTAITSFKSQYNTLMNSYNTIKSSYDKINQELKVYNIKQTKYDYGFMSKNDLDDAKLTFDTDKASFIKSRNDCYLAYLKYIEMKEGY